MIVERPVDCGALYDRERIALVELVRSLPDHQQTTPVPATPAWTILDVVAHLVGISADLNAGDLGGDDPERWTARQVAARAGRSIDELAQEWDAEAPRFGEGLRLFGYEVGSHFVGDLVQHVADVHHAVGRPRRSDDDEAVIVALDFYLDSFHESLLAAGVGALDVIVAGHRWRLGEGPDVASLHAERFELLRALGGRRSLGQLRALEWSGTVDGILPLVSRYGVPAAGLVEG